MKWMFESNRMKHFIYAIPCGLFFTILFVAGLAAGMEFKDRAWGGKWDWLDLVSTMMGGVIGQILQVIIFFIVYQYYK